MQDRNWPKCYCAKTRLCVAADDVSGAVPELFNPADAASSRRWYMISRQRNSKGVYRSVNRSKPQIQNLWPSVVLRSNRARVVPALLVALDAQITAAGQLVHVLGEGENHVNSKLWSWPMAPVRRTAEPDVARLVAFGSMLALRVSSQNRIVPAQSTTPSAPVAAPALPLATADYYHIA